MDNTANINTSIRLALETDAASIAKTLRAVGWFEHLTSESLRETESRIKRHIRLCQADDSHAIYIAENTGDGLIGYASVHWLPYLFLPGPEGYLSELFIEAAHRGKGIGKHLLETIIGEAKKRGCYRLMLITSRDRESYKREFYAKEGWLERDGMANFIFQL